MLLSAQTSNIVDPQRTVSNFIKGVSHFIQVLTVTPGTSNRPTGPSTILQSLYFSRRMNPCIYTGGSATCSVR